MTGQTAVSPAMRRARVVLIVVGVLVLVLGGVVLLQDVRPTRYPGLAAWLVGSLVLHDGIAAMAVFAVGLGLRRAGQRVPWVVIAIVQVALVVAAIVTLLVVPAIIKQAIGAPITVLPLPYALNLALFLVGLGVLAGAAVVIYLLASRQKARPSTRHD